MKKLLILLLSICLVFSTAVIAFAAENSGKVYFDYMLNGSANETIQGTGEADQSFGSTVTGYNFGGEYFINKIKLSAELGFSTSTSKDNNQAKADSNLFQIGGGYRLISNDQFDFDISGSYISLATKLNDSGTDTDTTLSGLMVGGDTAYKFTDQITFTASVGATLMGSISSKAIDNLLDGFEQLGMTTSKSSSILIYKFKCDYLINDNLGINLGYKALLPTVKYTISSGPATGEVSDKLSISSITLGASYRF